MRTPTIVIMPGPHYQIKRHFPSGFGEDKKKLMDITCPFSNANFYDVMSYNGRSQDYPQDIPFGQCIATCAHFVAARLKGNPVFMCNAGGSPTILGQPKKDTTDFKIMITLAVPQ